MATQASSAVAPVFTRSTARVGDRVGVVQPVRIGQSLHARTSIVIYLIRLQRAPSEAFDRPPPPSPAHHRLGELFGDRDGFSGVSGPRP